MEPINRLQGVALYYSRVILTEEQWLDLDWWEAALRLDVHVTAYSRQQGTLGISYGDGSGSGTGGTIQIGNHHGDCPTLEAWMGTWTQQVHSFSSNWKELRTLAHTLERELGGRGHLWDATLFYFTDNLVTYYIVSGGSSSSPELQKLLRRLKYLELVLGLRLEVVHIPGKHMIAQRTAGLSRGVRIGSGLPQRTPQQPDEILPGQFTKPRDTVVILISTSCMGTRTGTFMTLLVARPSGYPHPNGPLSSLTCV